MARRRSSVLEDLIEITSRVPWWVGVLLALATYFVLHHLSTADVAQPQGLRDLGTSVTQNAIKTFASLGQYLLPMIFLIGACVSAFKSKKQNSNTKTFDRVESQTTNQPHSSPRVPERDLFAIVKSMRDPVAERPEALSLGLLNSIDWKLFEEVCAEYFRICGFQAATQSHGPDGGIDIRLYAKDDTSNVENLVQCKQWSNRQVGPRALRELLGVMAASGVRRGTFVTTSTFTGEALQFGRGNGIHLIDGHQLIKNLLARTPEEQKRLLDIATQGDYLTPSCPSCGAKLKQKVGNTGRGPFWACPGFPACRYTLAIKRVT